MDPQSRAPCFEELLAHASWLRDLAHVLVADDAAADDVVQQTWLAALRHPPAAEGSPRAWFRRVLFTQIALRRRRLVHRRDREASAARDEALPSTEELVLRGEAQQRLARAVLELREPSRTVILLHFYEGVSSAEIARRRGVPDATVRSQLRRGLQNLREQLDDEYGDRRCWCVALSPLSASRAELKLTPAAPIGAAAVGAAVVLMLASALLEARTGVQAASPGPDGSNHDPLAAGVQSIPEAAERSPASPRSDGAFAVRLLDERTGEALPDCEVALLGPNGETLAMRTDAEGRFEVAGASGEWGLEVLDDARRLRLDAVVHENPIEVRMPRRRLGVSPAGSVSVSVPSGPTYVLDLDVPAHLELSELRAHLRASRARAFDTREWAMHMALVRPPGAFDGTWVRFTDVDPKFLGAQSPWVLEVSSDDGCWSGSAEVRSISGRHDGRLRIVLEPRATLRGRALDASGPASEDVLVKLLNLDGSTTYQRTDVGDDGRFDLAALAPGAYRLSIESPRHEPYEIGLDLEGGRETVLDVELVRARIAGRVEGTLESRTGRHRARVVVVLCSTEVPHWRFHARSRWEERDGRMVSDFAFDDVPAGRFALHAFACDDQLAWSTATRGIEAPASGLRLECRDDAETDSLALHAVDADGGEPVPSFRITYSFDDGPEVLLDHVKPIGAGESGAASFEWHVRCAGITWAVRNGEAQIPRAPRGRALRWRVEAAGYAEATGDETAFVEQDGSRVARVPLRREEAQRTEPRSK